MGVFRMRSARLGAGTVFTALFAAAAVLLGTLFLAGQAEKSRLYLQSRMLGVIAKQDQVKVVSLLTDAEKRGALTKFIGALTSAYINFELIPYNEGQTFAAVFQSLEDGVHVEQFEYKRRDFLIRGWALTPEAYDAFAFKLSQSAGFSSVTGHKYLAVDDTIRFEIWCVTNHQSAPLLAPQSP